MDYQKVRKIFPKSLLGKAPNAENYLDFKVEDDWFFVPKKELTTHEQEIIQLFKDENLVYKTSSEWQNFLYRNGVQPKSACHLRFLHFNIKNLLASSREEWQRLILSFFGIKTHYFWNNEQNFVIIDENCELTFDDLSGIITTIDTDFSTKTRLLVGLVWNRNDELQDLYHEECNILEKVAKKHVISTIPDCAIEYFTKYSSSTRSLIIKTYRYKFKGSDDLKQLVLNLYKVGGNITQAAKRMYIHRNTIEYRIDKLRKNYQINLHKMDDLIFSYLIFV